ncbi:MAG: helix-turn-helix domain-containing protein [Oscillospiraceae bacterium]|nr:helix-turn-helix domain-containing protein [Oscillospiraceae bacterium]
MEEDIKIEVGQILLDLRKNKGYSQTEIAKHLGITTAAYQNYEAGRREMNYKNIRKLADFYNVTIDYLLAREPKEEIDPIELLPVDDWKKALLRLYIAMDSESRPEMIEIIKKIANGVDVQNVKKSESKPQIQKSKTRYQATIGELEDERIAREQRDEQAKKNAG